jgi:tetratricopeptide (TPR) repeat protein
MKRPRPRPPTRADAYDIKKDYDKAIADYGKLIELHPKDAEAYVARGAEYIQTGKYDLAIADFDKATELDPKDADAYYERGFAYNRKEEHDRAIADFKKAKELDPTLPSWGEGRD